MPAYNSRAAQLPLTPPDSDYAYSDMHYSQDPYLHQSLNHPARQDVAYDYSQTYMQPVYNAQYPSGMYQSAAGAVSATTLPSISSYYEPMGAPVLPPLRMQDRMFGDEYQQRMAAYDYTREAPRQAKEERAVGGVSAKLDYDLDRMTSFVVSTTQYMYDLHCSSICLADIDITRSFKHAAPSSPAFKKWVYQVLSATRLPSATILLSLHYLSDRLKVFPNTVPVSDNQIYRLLAVALILGSKFLDDNTFINRSWSDVTAIKVRELNVLEVDWLGLIEYGLHVDNACVQTWVELWNKYDLDQSRETATRLSPLDTSMSRHNAPAARSRYSPFATPYSSSTLSSRTTFDSLPTPASSLYRAAPYSAVDPWAPSERTTYEDYYKRSGGNRYPMLSEFDEANNRRINYEQSRSRDAYAWHNFQSAPYSATAAPGHVQTWDMQNWYGSHRADCTCSNCAYRAWKPYTVAGSYSMGTVMG